RAEAVASLKKKSEAKNFAKENNLDLLAVKSLENEGSLVKALVGTSNLDQRLSINKSELPQILKTGAVSGRTAQKLCAVWSSDYMKKMYAAKGGALDNVMISPLGHDCYNQVSKKPDRFFQVQKHMMVKELGGSRFMRGLNQGLTIGTSFGMN